MTSATASMPTNKQRLTLNIPPELYKALEACAGRANRTLANQAAIALTEFLLKSGDLSDPVNLALQGRPRKSTVKAPSIIDDETLTEARGGKREGAGKKRSPSDDSADVDLPETTGKAKRVTADEDAIAPDLDAE